MAASRSNNFQYLRDCQATCKKEDFEVKDARGNTALWQAVSNLHLETVQTLIYEIRVDPDAHCELGNTVLHKLLMMD
jgi:hypothetical protein